MAKLAEKLAALRKYHVGAWIAFFLAAWSVIVALQPDLNFGYPDHKELGRRIVGFWAITPPVVFWIDGAFFLRYVREDRDIAIHKHDLGRNIWLALVGVLAALFQLSWPSS
jgi:hypothetical protein